MSLRRSARNVAQPAVSKVSGAPKENGIATHATSVIDANGNGVRDAEYPAPSPELQAKRGARKIGTAMVDTKVTKKKTVTPKKTSAPVKRKAPVTESEASTGIITNVANSRETPASTGAPPELINQIQPETPASIDVANPIETFTIPNDTLTDADFAAPGTQHGRVPTPDMPRGAEEGLSLPSTPVSKKRRKTKTDGVSPAKTVPFTPTPSGVGLIAGPENIARKPKNRAKTKNADHMLDSLASINRPAAPDVTNAPVLTSNGSQVVINDSPARKRKAADLPPDVGSPHKPANSTIETLLKDAEAYLVKVDETEKLAKLIENQRCKLFSPEGLSEAVDPFTALASGIMGQQVCLLIITVYVNTRSFAPMMRSGWTDTLRTAWISATTTVVYAGVELIYDSGLTILRSLAQQPPPSAKSSPRSSATRIPPSRPLLPS